MTVLKYEQTGAVVTLTLDDPASRNALTGNTAVEEFVAAARRIAADASVRVVILTGAGTVFSSGGNVKDMKRFFGEEPLPVDIMQEYRHGIQQLTRAVYHLEVPLIAAVNGPAIGLGCDVACMTDIRIAAEGAKFGVTFLKLGLIPGDGGAWLLPRTIGMSRAAELLFTGDVVDAATAETWGLVSKVVPAESLLDEAVALAERIAQQPPHALRLAKSLLKHGQTTSYDTLMEMSAAAQAISHLTEDHMEGVTALLEKRPATFKGA